MDLVIYHWWQFPDEESIYAYKNLTTPVILSIASLRGVNQKIPIVVLDISDKENDWADFPQILNFHIVKWKSELIKYQEKVLGWRQLSRLFDIWKWSEQNQIKKILYLDSDVFCFNDPFPLTFEKSEKLCFDYWNTGIFYCNIATNDEFFDIFQSYTKAAIHSEEIRNILKKFVGYDDNGSYGVWDEMILTYMVRHHPHLFQLIPRTEHSTTLEFEKKSVDQKNVKLFHANSTVVRNRQPKNNRESEYCRGLLAILVKEFYHNIMKSLNHSNLEAIYTKEQLDTYMPLQFNYLEKVNQLIKYKESPKTFNLDKFLQQSNWV